MCGWFLRLGNCFFAMKVLGVAPTEVTTCLAQSLAEFSRCWTWVMLFMAVAEGRLWMVELDGVGPWWRSNCMVGSMKEAVCGSLMDTLAAGGSVGTKSSMMIMAAMVVASALYGYLLWPEVGSENGFAFGSSFS
jgi:hypothetical protein